VVDVRERAPGIYWQEDTPAPPPVFLTGVPVFLGYAERGPGPAEGPAVLTLWPQFTELFGAPPSDSFLAAAVRGFFQNDGVMCHVMRIEDTGSPVADLRRALVALAGVDDADLVCVPDIMRCDPTSDPDLDTVVALQREVLAHCSRRGDCFAILDSMPLDPDEQRAALRRGLGPGDGANGALYHPWLWVMGDDAPPRYVPPCGHVAGAYSRSDRAVGVHKAPANEELDGVLDLRVNPSEADVGRHYANGVNCLRALPGRGIRVWGAHTLSDDPAWQHVNVRRVFLTLGRWLERFMTALVHEPNDVRLWVHIMRDLGAYLDQQYRRGALKGRTPSEAFYVKCDSETNTPETIDAGLVVTHVGLAPVAPAEFVVVRIIHGASGVSIEQEQRT
jgi:phage tail sheath protein FI